MKRLLYIAPQRAGLPVLDSERELEVLRASMPGEALEIDVMKGEVRLNDFALAVAGGGCRWNYMLFVAHGLPGEVAFSDMNGTPQWMASIIRMSCPELVMLGTCFSGVRDKKTMKNLAEEISASGITAVAAIRELEDQAAVVFDTEFIRSLVLGNSYQQAMSIALERSAQISQAFIDSVIIVPASETDIRQVSYSDVVIAIGAMREEFALIVSKLEELAENVRLGNLRASEALCSLRATLETLTIDHDLQKRMMKLLELSQGALLTVVERRAEDGFAARR